MSIFMPPLHHQHHLPRAPAQGAFDFCCPQPAHHTCKPTPAYLFIADNCGALRVVDPDTNKTVACTQVRCPAGIAIDCDLCKLYVANEQGSALTVLSTNNLQQLGCIPLQECRNTCVPAQDSLRLAVNPNNHRVYIPQPDSGKLAVVNGFHNSLMDLVRVGGCPVAAAVHSRTNLVYVANHTSEIPVLNSNSNQVFTHIILPGDSGVRDVLVNHCDNRIYALRDDGSIAVMNSTTNTLVQSVHPPGGGVTLALNPAIGLLFVINEARDAVLVYDTCTLEQVGTLDIAPSTCHCFAQLAVNTHTHLVYISDPCADTTYVMDGGMNIPIAEIPTAGQSLAVLSCAQNCPVCARR